MKNLIEKYNVPVPRYTSYPTVPNWKEAQFDSNIYLSQIKQGFEKANETGLALYIHLPYCESLCTYCGCNTRITVNHSVERPYIETLIKEWKLYLALFGEKPKIREIHLGGGTPTFFTPENLAHLIDSILELADVSQDASFSFEAHPNNTTDAHLQMLFDRGFDRLSLGVQDFDPVVQKAINRRQTPEDVQRVTAKARAIGYRSINYDLVYGLPFQTMEGVMDAVDKVIALRPNRIAFYSYAHVPWKRPGQRAYSEADLPDPETKLQLFMNGRDKLLHAGYQSIGFDHFALTSDSLYGAYKHARIHRNFMGYTDLRTSYLIGLGVSSISDIGSAFAQNAKTVEAYRAAVDRGEFPIVKGHLLDREEMYIRKHILRLICRHRTSWAEASFDESQYMHRCLGKLVGAEADGLVLIGDDEMGITMRGRLFVRNICAAFDRDYVSGIAERKFSMAV